jgi:transposase InsO family protein
MITQFDLMNAPDEAQLQNEYYGRRKLPNDPCKNAKEALVWDPMELKDCRSCYKDEYRPFHEQRPMNEHQLNKLSKRMLRM